MWECLIELDGRHPARDIETFYFLTYLLRHKFSVAGRTPPMGDRCGGVVAAVPCGSGVSLQ